DWHPLGCMKGGSSWWHAAKARGILREKIPFLFCGALVLTTLLARRDPSVVWAEPAPSLGLNGFERVMQMFYVWAYYIWKPWVPIHLSPVYTTLVQFSANGWQFWLSAASVLGISVGLFWGRRQWPWALAVWSAYLILLLPAL